MIINGGWHEEFFPNTKSILFHFIVDDLLSIVKIVGVVCGACALQVPRMVHGLRR